MYFAGTSDGTNRAFLWKKLRCNLARKSKKRPMEETEVVTLPDLWKAGSAFPHVENSSRFLT